MIRKLPVRVLATALLLLPLTGCLFRSHKVQTRYTTAKMLSATPSELIQRLDALANQIQTLNATVDIDTSVGGAKKGKVTEYQEIRGYILVKKPSEIRMIGLFPIVRNKAFDMVSNGQTFRLSIPAKNKFVIGSNEVSHPSKQPLENLRPQHIFDALLVRAIDPAKEIAVVEGGVETVIDPKTKKQVEEPNYIVTVIDRGEQGWFLARKIIFSREDLLPSRQLVYDKNGNLATDATYEQYTNYNGTWFPSIIHIHRPQEEYAITLHVLKLRLNEPLTAEQFELQQPPGSQLVRLDQTAQQQSASDGTPK